MKKCFYRLKAPLLLLFLLLPSMGHASLLDVKVQTDKTTLAAGEQLRLTVLITAEVSGSLPPPGIISHDGFDIIGTPYQSSSFSWINGKVSSSKKVTYTLLALKEGTYQIGEAEVIYKGQTYRAEPVEVTITEAEEGPIVGEEDEIEGVSGDPLGRVIVSTKLNKEQGYLGEGFVYTFSFFRKVRVWSSNLYPPNFSDFWVEDLPRDQEPREVIIKGIRYLREDIKKVLFPTRDGFLTIDGTSVTVQVDPFAKPIVLATEPLDLEIFSLPEAPENFTGAVGNFTMKRSVDRQKVKEGEPVTVTLQVAGSGNIKTIQPPLYEETDLFKGYEPKDRVDVSTFNDMISGTKTFEFLFIPQRPGTFPLPKFKFTYFDPVQEEYRTIEVDMPQVTVLKSEEGIKLRALSKKTSAVSVEGEKTLRPIRLKSSLSSWNPIQYFKGATLLLIVLPPLVFLVAFMKERKGRAEKHRKSSFMDAAAALKRAEAHLDEMNYKEFFSEIASTLTRYLIESHNVSRKGISNEELLEGLSDGGYPEDLLARIKKALAFADAGRFAPSRPATEKMEAFLNEVNSIIEICEKRKGH